MKKIVSLLLFALLFLVAYNIFLFTCPLKKTVFYTNEERIEEYVYDKNDYPIVLAGSSLSGAFEGKELFGEKNYLLYLPYTGAATGVEVIRRCNKIPKELFIEINHADRGIDSNLVNNIFSAPLYHLRFWLPFLQTKNKIFPNLIDRVKKPSNNKTNESKPSPELYNELMQKAQAEWREVKDTAFLTAQLDIVKQAVDEFAAKGCRIYFFEMPMDSSLTNSALIVRQRNYFKELALQKGYTFIGTDISRSYQTGDGVHLLKEDADIYTDYLIKEIAGHRKN